MTEPVSLGAAITKGDEDKYVVSVMASTSKGVIEINVYESLSEPGKTVIDIEALSEGDLENLIVTLNDGDLHRTETNGCQKDDCAFVHCPWCSSGTNGCQTCGWTGHVLDEATGQPILAKHTS